MKVSILKKIVKHFVRKIYPDKKFIDDHINYDKTFKNKQHKYIEKVDFNIKEGIINVKDMKKDNSADNLKEEENSNNTKQKINLKKRKFSTEKFVDSLQTDKIIKEEKDNYACVYYKYNINTEFDIFKLRNLLYSYLFVRQRRGDIYLNINDTSFLVNNNILLI